MSTPTTLFPRPPPTTTITLHWLEKSRSQRILFLLEELHIPYTLKTYTRGPDKLASPELRAVHPLGKSPVIEISDSAKPEKKSIVLAESALIVEYLCEYWGGGLVPARFEGSDGEGEGRGIGQETEAWMRYKYYMNYAEGSLMPYLVFSLVMKSVENAPVPFFIKPITRRIADSVYTSFLNPNLTRNFDFLEQQLASSPSPLPAHSTTTTTSTTATDTPTSQSTITDDTRGYFCGPLTAIDFLMVYPLEAAAGRVPDYTKSKYPLIFGWVERMQGRESYKKAVERIVRETGGYDPNF